VKLEDIEKFAKQPGERIVTAKEKLRQAEDLMPDKEKMSLRRAADGMDAWLAIFQQEAVIMRDSYQATTLSNTAGKSFLEKVKTSLDGVILRSTELMQADQAECQSVYAGARSAMFTGSSIGIGLGAILGFLVLWKVKKTLAGVIDGLSRSPPRRRRSPPPARTWRRARASRPPPLRRSPPRSKRCRRSRARTRAMPGRPTRWPRRPAGPPKRA
jgi:hypothetical protein